VAHCVAIAKDTVGYVWRKWERNPGLQDGKETLPLESLESKVVCHVIVRIKTNSAY
jgi:hypothetical protein